MEMCNELKRFQPEDTSKGELREMVNDMRKQLRGEEDAEYKMNQKGLGVKQLFQGFIINE